jgi:hypothetical protein
LQLVTTTRKRWLSGWKLFGLSVAVLAAGIWIDGRIKSNAPAQGYCPPAAEAILSSPDFGSFWIHALSTEQVQRIRADWRRAEAGIELSIRNLTGIRPTPSRWRLWMGHRFVAAASPEGYGVCTYPGLLLRAVSAVHGRIQSPIDASGVRPFGELFYAWRDGFVIVSNNAEYVRKSLEAEPLAMEPGLPARAIRFESRVEPIVAFEVLAADEFPMIGELPNAITDRSAPMTLWSAWESPPMAACSASTWGDIAQVLTIADDALTRSEHWQPIRKAGEELFTEWGLTAPPDTWPNERLDHCALVLEGFDTGSNVPYPELAFVVRSTLPAAGAHPLAQLVPAEYDSIPYQWNGNDGLLYPMAGAQWAPCLSHSGRDWLAASRERVMAELAPNLGDGMPGGADLAIHIDWQQVSAALTRIVARNDQFELVPELSRDEVRARVAPIAQAVRHLGQTLILGKRTENGTVLEGRLARRIPEPSS